MKNIITLLFILLLTGCTREYFVFVYVQPENKIPVGQSVLLPYIEGPYIPTKVPITHTPVDRNVVGELPAWFDTVRVSDGDFIMDCNKCETWTIEGGDTTIFMDNWKKISFDKIIKEAVRKTDSTLLHLNEN